MPKTQLQISIGKLRQSSARLNELTDSASATVREVEHFLNEECSIGISAFVQVHEASFPGDEDIHLCYERLGGRFRIAISWQVRETPPDEERLKPFSDATRDAKLLTIKFLPTLLGEIAKKVDEKIVQIETAMKSVKHQIQSVTDGEA